MNRYLLHLTVLGLIILGSCNSQVASTKISDDKFLGSWQYLSNSNHKKEDGSMTGQIATIRNLEGTKESYTMSYLNLRLNFTKENDSLLVGVGNIFKLRYIEKNGKLHYFISPSEYHEFKKLN